MIAETVGPAIKRQLDEGTPIDLPEHLIAEIPPKTVLAAASSMEPLRPVPTTTQIEFSSRLSQLQFFIRSIGSFMLLVAAFATLVGAIWLIGLDQKGAELFLFPLIIIFVVANSVYQIVISVWRLHDMNISGWVLVPVLFGTVILGALLRWPILTEIGGAIVYLCLLLIPGDKAENKYGAIPVKNIWPRTN